MTRYFCFILLWVLVVLPFNAKADEIFMGAFAHGVGTPLSMETGDRGIDFQMGYRFDSNAKLKAIGQPSPYFVASINTQDGTNFLSAGLGWQLRKGQAYVRPEIGLAIHDGPSRKLLPNGRYGQLGSRVLFQPGISIGAEISQTLSIEASWMHLSHAQLFNSNQNPGLDVWGLRANWKI